MNGRPLLSLLKQVEGRSILLAGELSRSGALADSLLAIVRAGWTGELIVVDGTARRSFFIRDAAIVGAVTDVLEERIGALMIRMRMLDPEQLATIVARLGSGARFGELAIDQALLSRERLLDVVRIQAEEILAGAVAVADGAFVFTEGFDPGTIVAHCQLDAREAVDKALARLSLADAPVAPTAPPASGVGVGHSRSASTAIGIVVTAALVFASAFLLARAPKIEHEPTPPIPSAPAPTVAASPSAAPSPVVASVSASASTAAPAATVGTVRTADSGGHRVWIDGKLVGQTPQAFEVTCGLHVIRVGSAGQPQMTEVPCGGEVEVAFR